MWASSLLRRTGITLAALMLLGFGVQSIRHGIRIALTDANTLGVRWTIGLWRDGKGPVVTPELWTKTRDELLGALQVTPDNPQLHEDLGYLHASRAIGMGWPKMDSPEELVRQDLLLNAIKHYRAAIALRPTFPHPWAYIAFAKHLQGNQDAEFWLAFDKALLLGSFAEGVQPVLAKLAFAQWLALTPERRQRVTTMITSASGQTRLMLIGMIEKAGVEVPGMIDTIGTTVQQK